MAGEKSKGKIKILKNGPYVVTGNVPLEEKIIVPKGKWVVYEEGEKFSPPEPYTLCRCGHSKTPPYCDGSHVRHFFNGTETASKAAFADRATVKEGPGLSLMDDERCAYARFCHREKGTAWNLVDRSDDPELREEAIRAAVECPAGRLVVLDTEGKEIEPELEPGIEILQDPQKEVSGPIYVKGCIPVESADGTAYEPRNRITLCRCGKSCKKPFCDASHIHYKYKDREVKSGDE